MIEVKTEQQMKKSHFDVLRIGEATRIEPVPGRELQVVFVPH